MAARGTTSITSTSTSTARRESTPRQMSPVRHSDTVFALLVRILMYLNN